MSVPRRHDNGTAVPLDPRVQVVRTATGFALLQGLRRLVFESDSEGSITEDVVQAIRNAGMYNDAMWSDPELCRQLYTWTSELESLASWIQDQPPGPGLDVGCGFGRLLRPLNEMGFTIDGIDQSRPLLLAAKDGLSNPENSRFFAADIVSFCMMDQYTWAYSAMNAIRYLGSEVRLKEHLHSMAGSVVPGGRYLVYLSIADPEEPWENTLDWFVDWGGRKLRVDWEFHDYCHLRRLIIERVTFVDCESDEIVYEEYQAQAHYTDEVFAACCHNTGWVLEEITNSKMLNSPHSAVQYQLKNERAR